MSDGATLLSIFSLIVFVYMLPALLGLFLLRSGKIKLALFNLLAGWTLIGWLASLVWVFTSNKK